MTSKAFTHYSKHNNIISPKDANLDGGWSKPFKALWLSDDEIFGWKHFCLQESYNLSTLKYVREIQIRMEDVLTLRDVLDLDRFTLNYYGKFQASSDFAFNKIVLDIDWLKVSKKFSAVYIKNIINYDKTSHAWYSGWDCASVAILKKECIANISEPRLTEIEN